MANKYEVKKIMRKFDEYRTYKKVLKEWRLIRSLYKGEFWEVFKNILQNILSLRTGTILNT